MSDFNAYRNRLIKNIRHISKWARRQGITCFRVYDCDIPQFPITIDFYEGRVHLQEVNTGWIQSDEDHHAWLNSLATITSEVLDIPSSSVSLKHREKQKGHQQYEKTGSTGEDFIVHENGLKFIVNLDAYLDTGLFLDHRTTRSMVRSEAQGKRFLNLFAYTGSFTVYAASGGATHSTTVDLSNTYQSWTQRNLELNQINLSRHELVRADVFSYLENAIIKKEKFDLIVLDPPSFSNSKKMLGILDVQQDHPKLIRQAMDLLNPQGKLFFSNNLRSFSLDENLSSAMNILDITTKTIPEDFRDKKIHHCYLITK